MASFYIKRGDVFPKIRCELKDADGSALDLRGAIAVNFYMRARGASALKVNGVADVVNAEAGVVEYGWETADTDTVGNFEAEWEAVFPTGSITVPNRRFLTIRVESDLG